MITLRSVTFPFDEMKSGSRESVQTEIFMSFSCLYLFRSEWNWLRKKKGVIFIPLDGYSVKKEFHIFLTVLACHSWLLPSSMLGILSCTLRGLEAYKKNLLKNRKKKKRRKEETPNAVHIFYGTFTLYNTALDSEHKAGESSTHLILDTTFLMQARKRNLNSNNCGKNTSLQYKRYCFKAISLTIGQKGSEQRFSIFLRSDLPLQWLFKRISLKFLKLSFINWL